MSMTPLPLKPSTSIASASYDPETQDLHVTFANGRAYTLPDVPQQVADDFSNAGSPGTFWNQSLKGRYG